MCITATYLLFGGETRTAFDCNICDSRKMRVAAKVSGNRKYFN
jgi:hypothetical protein